MTGQTMSQYFKLQHYVNNCIPLKLYLLKNVYLNVRLFLSHADTLGLLNANGLMSKGVRIVRADPYPSNHSQSVDNKQLQFALRVLLISSLIKAIVQAVIKNANSHGKDKIKHAIKFYPNIHSLQLLTMSFFFR